MRQKPGSVHTMRIKNFIFQPEHVEVRVDDTIRWTNEDLAPYTVTADEFGWDTEEITKGGSADIVVSDHMETGNARYLAHPEHIARHPIQLTDAICTGA